MRRQRTHKDAMLVAESQRSVEVTADNLSLSITKPELSRV